MSEAFEIVKTGIDFFCSHLVFFNMLFAIVIVFFQRRDPKSVWAWLLLLYFIPVLGFVFYLLLGQDMHKRKMFRIKEVEDHISKDIRQQEYRLRSRDVQELDENIRGYEDLVMYNLEAGEAMLTKDNDVDIFIDGNEKFRALMEDLRNAEHFIHIQYYIIKNDVLFNQIRDILIEKAAQGVEVRVLFDAMGCRSVRHSFWRKLNEKGVQTAEFFPAILRRLQLRINYRNHRKIVVIDGTVAYTGGVNLADEYINQKERFGHWKDTAVMLKGEAVWNMTAMFLHMWNVITNNREDHSLEEYLPHVWHPEAFEGDGYIQPFCDSPLDNETVGENVYLNIINRAKRYVYICTPYLVIDNEMMTALCLAAKSGVDVRLMTPGIPDKKLVFLLTQSYYEQLLEAGVKIYEYQPGFLHAKSFVCDDEIAVVGTINLDYRSLYLHFEDGVWIYRNQVIYDIKKDFTDTLEYCNPVSLEFCRGRNIAVRAMQSILRLFAPML